jgi:hypothetical protein
MQKKNFRFMTDGSPQADGHTLKVLRATNKILAGPRPEAYRSARRLMFGMLDTNL